MKKSKDENFKWLRLLYTIQQNKSNATKRIQAFAKGIEERKVKFDGKYTYWFECEEYSKDEQNSHFMQGHRHKIFNDDEVEKIKKMCTNGISNRQIAKQMKCSETTIRNYRKKIGF